MDKDLRTKLLNEMDRIAKWRSVYAGWQLGTRSDTDPEAQAVRDMFDKFIALRVEVSAFTMLMIKKGIFTEDELVQQLLEEITVYDQQLMRRWPGARATSSGMSFDIEKSREWMSKFKP